MTDKNDDVEKSLTAEIAKAKELSDACVSAIANYDAISKSNTRLVSISAGGKILFKETAIERFLRRILPKPDLRRDWNRYFLAKKKWYDETALRLEKKLAAFKRTRQQSLRQRRNGTGYTQAEAAHRACVSVDTIRRWDRGKCPFEGYPGRENAVVFDAWLARMDEGRRLKKAMSKAVRYNENRLSHNRGKG